MKSKIAGLAFFVVCSSQVMSQEFEWVNVKVNFFGNTESAIEQVDIRNITAKNGMKFFWLKTNFAGTKTATWFTYVRVDCKKKMWQSTYFEGHNQFGLVEKKDSTNHSFPWNYFDFNDIGDRRTYQLVCG